MKNVLDQIGSDECWKKITEKEKKKSTDIAIPNDIWEIIKKKEDKRKERLKDIPFYSEKISKAELEQIIFTREFLFSCIDAFEKDLGILKSKLSENSPEYKKQAGARMHARLKQIEDGLDKMDLWTTKFSTDWSGGRLSNGEELSENKEKDSIYYATDSGVGLRIRKASLKDGMFNLRDVIQPFAEKIFYKHMKNTREIDILLKPEIGSLVNEFFSCRFKEAIETRNAKSDFISEIKIYKKDGVVVDLIESDGSTGHNGDAINKIIFQKNWYKI